VELLPNIFEFSTEKYGIHEYAAIYGIEKILRRTSSTKLLKSEPNYYLERQHKRLSRYAQNGQIAEFNRLSRIILKKSISFRILALNRTVKDWFLLPIRNLRRIWKELSHISSTLSSDLRFKRVWIDKKEGDYARPLGVPTPAWRCYSFMWMDHIEQFYKNSGYLQPWQHGGRSGVGVLSCYKQLIPRIRTSNTIFEFDIKGFFDNISHEAIIKRFKETMGSETSNWIQDILAVRPSKYVLPTQLEDKAYQAYLAGSRPASPNADIFEREWKVVATHGPASVSIDYLNHLRGIPTDVKFEDLTPEMVEFYKEKQKIDTLKRHNIQMRINEAGGEMLIPLSGNATDLIGYFEEVRQQVVGQQMLNRPRSAEIPLERELTRDKWKNLGQPGKGVPQGLGTSPFISTFLTDTHLYNLGTDLKALIMYMDDGILFANSKAEMEKLIVRLKELLKGLGLEIAPEKSSYAKEDGVWKHSLKFLGLRYLPESDSFMSDTRSGTQVLFPSQEKWEDIRDMAALNNLSIPYMRKKFDLLINTQAYEAGLKHGFLGCLIAGSQYKDAPTTAEKKEDVRRGQASAWARVEKSKGFIWKSQDLVNHTEYLTNVSSIACHRFAEFNRLGRKLFVRGGN
jgi:hypothetical protein